MSIQTQLTIDLQKAIQHRDVRNISILKLIVGELQRLPNKVLTDAQTVATLRKLANDERENLDRAKEKTSPYMEILLHYLPPPIEQVSEQEIKEWIFANISQEVLTSNQKFSCIKTILSYFGDRTNGNIVKKVVSCL